MRGVAAAFDQVIGNELFATRAHSCCRPPLRPMSVGESSTLTAFLFRRHDDYGCSRNVLVEKNALQYFPFKVLLCDVRPIGAVCPTIFQVIRVRHEVLLYFLWVVIHPPLGRNDYVCMHKETSTERNEVRKPNILHSARACFLA